MTYLVQTTSERTDGTPDSSPNEPSSCPVVFSRSPRSTGERGRTRESRTGASFGGLREKGRETEKGGWGVSLRCLDVKPQASV